MFDPDARDSAGYALQGQQNQEANTPDDFDPFLSEEEMEAEAQRLDARRLEVATLFFHGYIEGAEAKDAIEAIRQLLKYDYFPTLDQIIREMRLQEPELTEAETLRAIREETDEEEPTLAEIIARFPEDIG